MPRAPVEISHVGSVYSAGGGKNSARIDIVPLDRDGQHAVGSSPIVGDARTQRIPVRAIPAGNVRDPHAARRGEGPSHIQIIPAFLVRIGEPLDADVRPIRPIPACRVARQRIIGIREETAHIKILAVRVHRDHHRQVHQPAVQLEPVRPVKTRHVVGARIARRRHRGESRHITRVAHDRHTASRAIQPRRTKLVIPMLVARHSRRSTKGTQ